MTPAAAECGAGGTVTSTCVSFAGLDLMLMVPPASQTIDRQIVNPRPLPFGLVVKTGSSTRDKCSGAIPDPPSVMTITTPSSPMLGADSHPTASDRLPRGRS